MVGCCFVGHGTHTLETIVKSRKNYGNYLAVCGKKSAFVAE